MKLLAIIFTLSLSTAFAGTLKECKNEALGKAYEAYTNEVKMERDFPITMKVFSSAKDSNLITHFISIDDNGIKGTMIARMHAGSCQLLGLE